MSLEQAAHEAILKLKSAQDCHPNAVKYLIEEAQDLLEQALAQQEKPEPVAQMFCKANRNGTWTEHVSIFKPSSLVYHVVKPLYTQPPRRDDIDVKKALMGAEISMDVSKGDEPENRIYGRIYDYSPANGQHGVVFLAVEESRNFDVWPRREWVSLSEEHKKEIEADSYNEAQNVDDLDLRIMNAVESKLKELNT